VHPAECCGGSGGGPEPGVWAAGVAALARSDDGTPMALQEVNGSGAIA
jgi:hypothetical protein